MCAYNDILTNMRRTMKTYALALIFFGYSLVSAMECVQSASDETQTTYNASSHQTLVRWIKKKQQKVGLR